MANFEAKVRELFTQNADGASFDAYTSIGSQIQVEGRAKVFVEKKFFPKMLERFQLVELPKPFIPAKVEYSLDLTEAVAIGKSLTAAYMTTDYRRVLQDPYWMQLFNVQDRDFNYIEGTTARTSTEASLPCYNCGLILPATHITIDHMKPQAGGQDQSILKVLRGLSSYLTMMPGKGHFATAYREGTTDPLPTKAGRDDSSSSSDFGKERRYTLTAKGMTMLSVLIASTGLQPVLNACMHSAFNLRPYCAKCNIAKSNVLTDLSWIN
ncbi:hypothetical protein [Trinickia acidisoli]|uniref:hypothetical protein n=1 Tax=Trinickia acidisoli TaxID=2767482 RepID=UPI001A8FD8BA|nr:hypothetical protein [Trinickia acidisoli]